MYKYKNNFKRNLNMSKRSIKIANCLCLQDEERMLYAGLLSKVSDWFKKKGLQDKDIPSAAQDLNKYLHKSNKIDLVKIPEDYKTGKINYAKIEVLIKALSNLKEQMSEMKSTTWDKGHKSKIQQIKSIIQDLKSLKSLLDKNE